METKINKLCENPFFLEEKLLNTNISLQEKYKIGLCVKEYPTPIWSTTIYETVNLQIAMWRHELPEHTQLAIELFSTSFLDLIFLLPEHTRIKYYNKPNTDLPSQTQYKKIARSSYSKNEYISMIIELIRSNYLDNPTIAFILAFSDWAQDNFDIILDEIEHSEYQKSLNKILINAGYFDLVSIIS